MLINTDAFGAVGERIMKALLKARAVGNSHTNGHDPDLHADMGFIEVKMTAAYYLHYDSRDDVTRIDSKSFVFPVHQHKGLLDKLYMVDGFYALLVLNGKNIVFKIVPLKEISPYVKKSKAKYKVSVPWTRFFTDDDVGPPPPSMRKEATGGRWAWKRKR